MPVKPFRPSTPKQRANSAALVRVGTDAFTYPQIAARLGCTVIQAQRKVRGIRARQSNNVVTWATLGAKDA